MPVSFLLSLRPRVRSLILLHAGMSRFLELGQGRPPRNPSAHLGPLNDYPDGGCYPCNTKISVVLPPTLPGDRDRTSSDDRCNDETAHRPLLPTCPVRSHLQAPRALVSNNDINLNAFVNTTDQTATCIPDHNPVPVDHIQPSKASQRTTRLCCSPCAMTYLRGMLSTGISAPLVRSKSAADIIILEACNVWYPVLNSQPPKTAKLFENKA